MVGVLRTPHCRSGLTFLQSQRDYNPAELSCGACRSHANSEIAPCFRAACASNLFANFRAAEHGRVPTLPLIYFRSARKFTALPSVAQHANNLDARRFNPFRTFYPVPKHGKRHDRIVTLEDTSITNWSLKTLIASANVIDASFG